MRDAFGGSFMLKIGVIFFVLYISFMAIALNYAKVFRVKNGVIDLLEKNQYNMSESLETEEKIKAYLSSMSYKLSAANVNVVKNDCSAKNKRYIDGGVCIEKMGTEDNPYYKVTAYIAFDLPLLSSGIIPVDGETTVMSYNVSAS